MSVLPFEKPASLDLYVVDCEHWEKPGRRDVLGYAVGQIETILAYYDDGSRKDVQARRIEINTITTDMVDKRKRLLAERRSLYVRLGELERELLEER